MSVEDYYPLLAIYGAILSTILAILEVGRFYIERQERKPKMEVQITYGLTKTGREVSEPLINLTAANVGDRAISLTSPPSLLLPDGKKMIMISAESSVIFPYDLLPGKSCMVWEENSKVARGLNKEGYSGVIEIVGEFTDAIGNKYRSKSFKLNIDQWL